MDKLYAFKTALKSTDLSTATVTSYINAIEDFNVWLRGQDGDIDSNNPEVLITYVNYLVRQNLSLKTINLKISAINKYISLIKPGLKTYELLPDVSSDFEINIDPIWVQMFLSNIEDSKNSRHKAIIYFMLYAGLHTNEIGMVKEEDIDIDGRILKVGNNRRIPIHKRLLSSIQEYLTSKYYRPHEKGYLFHFRGPISHSGVFRIINKYSNGYYNPSTLINFFFKKLAEKDVPLDIIYYLNGRPLIYFKEPNIEEMYRIIDDINY